MRPWLRRSLLVLATFATCWAGVVWYWRETHRMPGMEDLLLALVLLPLLVLLAGGLLLWSSRKLIAAGAASAPAPAGADAAPQAATTPAAAPADTLSVLAGALRMPHGDTPDRLASALLARRARLELDPELRDDGGYPILSGRIADIDIATQQDDMADWLREQHPHASFSEEQWRALALGSAVAADLAAELGPHPALPVWLDAAAAGKPLPPLPALQVITLLPAEWAAAERQAAAGWLRDVVARHGWPAARLAPALEHTTGQPPLPLIGELARHTAQQQQPFLCLLLACHSRIGTASVEQWAFQYTLFDSDHPQGRIPGEGAAGLLLADRAQGALFAHAGAALLHPARSAVRSSSADSKPRSETGLLAGLANQALSEAKVQPGAVQVLAADSDQRASRMGELLGMATATLPELDPGSQVLTVAAACGDAGDVSTLAALVLAQQQVSAGAEAALCISNLDPFQRDAVLLTAA